MRITDIKISPPLGPQNRNWVLLKIFTDQDIVGLGEWAYGAPEGAFEGLRRRLIGNDPLNLNRLHYSGQPERGLWQMGGLGAGVEIALWDIMGKKLGAPLWQLLGGKLRNRIRMYCDCHAGEFWTADEFSRRWKAAYASGELDPIYEPNAFVEMAKRRVEEGFTCIKFDADFPNPWKEDVYDRSIGLREHEPIVSAMEKVREAVGSLR